ncbi:helix-turn-helix domain-containing protein [Streptomyces niveus]|uniref:helix-turn-helix domain-containing protein n=1 Tax=Streptomyces niveus TaxID=193462 RepID=UPI003445445A
MRGRGRQGSGVAAPAANLEESVCGGYRAGRPAAAGGEALAALLGSTRARVLVHVAADPTATATDLVHRLGVSAATVSQHASVLRRSGLITTRRTGGSVRHAVTSLGHAVLDAHGMDDPR